VERVIDLAGVMDTVARTLHHSTALDDLLHLAVRAARDTIPGVELAGISVLRPQGVLETVAATDALVLQVDQLQYDLGEGPCVEAARDRVGQRTGNIVVDHRWPRYGPRAAELGLCSQMAVPLYVEDDQLGALNLYASRPDAFDENTIYVASLFATHAALSMGRTMVEDQLKEALDTRKLIHVAVGLVMERYQLDEVHAFSFLARVAETAGSRLVVVAQELVDRANWSRLM